MIHQMRHQFVVISPKGNVFNHIQIGIVGAPLHSNRYHRRIGIDRASLTYSTYDVLLNDTPTNDAIMLTKQVRLDLLPATTGLAGAEVELVGIMAREYRMRRALQQVADRSDFVFIDCPPSLGLLTINSLSAAKDGVLIPVQCEYLALEGLGHLLKTIYMARDNLHPDLVIAGVILTMYDARTNLSKQVVDEVRHYFPAYVFRTLVPRTVRLSEAPSFGETILSFAPTLAGAVAYRVLARELMERNSD